MAYYYCYDKCLYAECHYAECHYAECHYAECHYAECHYAECHGTFVKLKTIPMSGVILNESNDWILSGLGWIGLDWIRSN